MSGQVKFDKVSLTLSSVALIIMIISLVIKSIVLSLEVSHWLLRAETDAVKEPPRKKKKKKVSFHHKANWCQCQHMESSRKAAGGYRRGGSPTGLC